MANETILVADDDPGVVEHLKLNLTKAGYKVISAVDGYQAVALARQHEPDACILDINMPAGDGFSVHERLRKMEPNGHVPIIYVTGDSRQRARPGKDAGALIRKPIEISEVLFRLRVGLEKAAAAKA